MKPLSIIFAILIIVVLCAFLVYNSIGLVKAIKKWKKKRKDKKKQLDTDDGNSTKGE